MRTAACFLLVSGFLICSYLTGCGVAHTISQTSDKMVALEVEVEKSLGTRPKIGWRVQGDHLAEITVQFDSLPDEKMCIAELKEKVRAVIEQKIVPMPDHIVISVQVQ